MSSERFELECDRLSLAVDRMQHERLLWERNEGPMLARLVTLAAASLEARSEFEFAEEGSTPEAKRFVLKVHGQRIVAIAVWLEQGRVLIGAEAIERSKYRVLAGAPVSAEYSQVDAAWMAAALQELFSRVEG